MKDSNAELYLARAKFEYSAKLYKEESDNFEYSEKKAQMFFSFIAIFLSAILLNIDFINTIARIVQTSSLSTALTLSLYFALGAFVFCVFVSILCLAGATHIQTWMREYPDNLAFSLYAPNSEFLDKHSEIAFLNKIGLNYAIAIEYNKKINAVKSRRLQFAITFIYGSLVSFFVLLVLAFISLIS